MRAVRVHEPGDASVLRVETIADPVAGEGQLLVEVEAAGLNFIEIYQRNGLYPMQRPYVVGSEAGGVVRAIGAGVSGFKVGDRVVSQNAIGSFAELTVIPAVGAIRIPDGIETKVAVAAWLQGLTAHYLATSTFPLKKGDRCLIHAAAGGVGLIFCQIAKKRGAFVIGTASSDEKRALAKAAGADEVIDYTTQDFAAEVKRITNGQGLHVVYDSVGKTTWEHSLDCLAPRGMLVLFGNSSGAVPPFDPLLLARKGSLYVTRPTLAHYVVTRQELEARAGDLFAWIKDGSLKVRIGGEYPLDKAADAQRALEGRSTTGKVILTVTAPS
jgi:NADPH2:quinone reductase